MLLAAFLCAAPVPPPPAKVEPHHLAGVWDYAWGQQVNGEVVFCENGTYTSRHSPREDGAYTHVGLWAVEDNVLTLRETCVCDGWAYHHLVRYEIKLDPRRYPVVSGVCGATEVLFSNPRREVVK